MTEENVVRVPEIGLTSRFMDDLRTVIGDDKYDKLTVAELTGAMEMVKVEYLMRWMDK